MQVPFSSVPSAGTPTREKLYLAIIIVVALIYRLLPLNRGLGEDELFTVVQFIEVPSIFRTVFYNIAFNNHIGFSLMARLSEAIFGHSEWALRLPALILGVGTLYILYIFSRSLLGSVPALLATLLLALAPPHISWSVQARGYSGMILFTLLSSYFFFKLLRQPNRRDAIFFIASSVFGIYVHLYAVFTTGIQLLFVIYLAVLRSSAKTSSIDFDIKSLRLFRNCFVAIGVLVLMLYVPVVWFLLRDLAGRGWGDFNALFPWEVAKGLIGSNWSPVVIVVLLTCMFGWFSLHQSHRFEANYFAWLLVAPLLLMWLVHPFDLYPRFFAYWLPYLLILFTAGIIKLSHFVWKESRLVFYLARCLAVAIVLMTLLNWTLIWQNAVADEGYRQVSQAVLQGADPAAAYCAIGGDRSIWKYYIKKPIVNPLTLAEFQELSRQHPEVRCVYYAASWQDQNQTDIAQYLFEHASSFRVKELTWFVLRRNGLSTAP